MDLVAYCCVGWFVITCELAGGVGGWSLVGMLLWVGWLFVFGYFEDLIDVVWLWCMLACYLFVLVACLLLCWLLRLSCSFG